MKYLTIIAVLLLATGCTPLTHFSVSVVSINRTVSNVANSSSDVEQDGTQAADKDYEGVASGNTVDASPGL